MAALMELAEGVGLSVRSLPAALESSGPAGGSLVKLRGKEILFLDSSAAMGDQLNALAVALKNHKELEDRFIAPEVRQAIEQAS